MAERRGVERGPSPPTNQHHVWVPTNLLMQSVVCYDSSPCQPASQPTTRNINKGRVSAVAITTVTPQPCLNCWYLSIIVASISATLPSLCSLCRLLGNPYD
ncbi:hypothetical protein Pmani_036485 [Petrolisthes manimaculis]|uniref:Uncharacterized protein n=1 Tax=Petrolisthes manimaculis TaxID=1843537 RepID=A0AAE1TPC2_9EUCA|nr:hypothetical protein Pmani_036485 [Petrolisthes manimaculis]